MRGAAAERFCVWSLRAMATGFGVVGLLFVLFPAGVLEFTDDIGDAIGSFTPAEPTEQRFWLALAFSYMVVITGIALIAQADVRRHRPMILVLAAGKAASALTALVFFMVDDAFIQLLNFLVDGSLVGAALAIWWLAGRAGPPSAPA